MWDPKPDAPVEFRGEFGVGPTNVPGITLSRHAADVRRDHGQMVHRPQPLPQRRRPLHRRPALLHRLPGRPATPTKTSTPAAARSSSKQLGGQNPRLPAYVMIPRMVPGTGPAYLGVAHKPFETKADPANAGPFRAAQFLLAGWRDAGTAGRPPRPARRLRPAAPRRGRDRPDGRPGRIHTQGLGHPDLAGGARRLRPRPRAGEGARALRLPAGVRPAARPTAAAPRRGASASCWPGGWWRRACGW